MSWSWRPPSLEVSPGSPFVPAGPTLALEPVLVNAGTRGRPRGLALSVDAERARTGHGEARLARDVVKDYRGRLGRGARMWSARTGSSPDLRPTVASTQIRKQSVCAQLLVPSSATDSCCMAPCRMRRLQTMQARGTVVLPARTSLGADGRLRW